VLRVFHPGIPKTGSVIHLDREEAHHLFHVLRARKDEKIIVLNGYGYYAEGHILNGTTQEVIIDSVHFAESSKITLCSALLKNKAMDFLIREATAIGVAGIIPLYTQNSEVKIQNVSEKQMHWHRIAREACKQSGNPYLPTIEIPRKLKDFQFSVPTFVAALRKDAKNIFHYQSEVKNNPVAILIGPEGDFSEQEYQYFIQNNFHFIYLGKHILRAETAALYLLSVIDHICLRTRAPKSPPGDPSPGLGFPA
jgi:16S rRNA (uracil1498-N3)-methyltransferase